MRSRIVLCMNHGWVILGITSFKSILTIISRRMSRSGSGS